MADEVRANELLVLKEEEPKQGEKYAKEGFKLRVVQWIYAKKGKNARPGEMGSSVKLERRKFFLNEEGDVRTGKAEGFSLEDMKLIQANWKQIIDVMTNPPEVKDEPKQEETGGNLEEVPF